MAMTGTFAISRPSTTKPPREMTLKEFMEHAGNEDVKKLFNRVNTGSFSACHTAFYEATGIWIPELVPVFKKLDAMLVLGDEINPVELSQKQS